MPQRFFFILLIALLTAGPATAQRPAPVRVISFADQEFDRSRLHRWLLGSNWRAEWAAPVTVPEVSLDTLEGGLHPYQAAGSGESRSLRLRSADGREWVLRSVAKRRSALLPPFWRRSFYGKLVQDGVSMSHPYAALALPGMLQRAGIPHTRPRLVYVPRQPGLDSFNDSHSGEVYLLEQRAAGDWHTAPRLGGYTRYLATEEVQQQLRSDSRLEVDQRAFIRARLFDVLIADVDRHEGNWRWGVSDTGRVRFHPVPVDRDQAFFYHNGLLTPLTLYATRRRRLQRFGNGVRNVATLGTHNGVLDRQFTNALTANDWQAEALTLKAALTDSVIRASVQQLPAPVFELSGERIIHTLQQRRDELPALAARFYAALARDVTIHGSTANERFTLQRQPNGGLLVTIHQIDASGSATLVYQRLFAPNETKQLILDGGGGADVFEGDVRVGKKGVVKVR